MVCCELVTYIGTGVCIVVCLFYLLRKYMHGRRCESNARLDGKIVVITGANTGIGKETAIDLAKRGATVIAACRSHERGLKAVSEIRERSKNTQIFFKSLDLASLDSVREFADEFKREFSQLDILLNNAGVMACPYSKTKDGFEMQIGTNHLGHFALTNLLLDHLKKAAPSRIVSVSSLAHLGAFNGINFDDLQSEKSYSAWGAYNQSKLANVLFTKELHRKLQHHGITSYSLHPGAVDTDLQRHSIVYYAMRLSCGILTKPPVMGAQTSIYCAVTEGLEEKSGLYFNDCAVATSSKASHDEGAAKKLWEVSEKLTNVKFPL